MTTLRDKLIDGAKGGAAETIRFTPVTARTAGADGIVGPTPVPASIDPTTGLFTTPELVPGPYVVRIKWRSIAMGEEYRIAVPDTGTNLGLWPLIAAYIQLPPDTPMELLAKYFEANPVNVGGLTEEVADTRYAPVSETYRQLARTPDVLIAGAVTRNSDGAATSAPVVWPDGTAGTYTATTLSTAFPGAVDAYTVTYGLPVTKTYTQPAVTRDANGAATAVPAIVVS